MGGKKKPAVTADLSKTGRRRLDREAIERDYRTGKFTLRELEAKHGMGYADISRLATKEGWTKDLAAAVKQATTAALIQELTTTATTNAQRNTTNVVLAAAEMNKQVILGHRKALVELAADAAKLKAKLLSMVEAAADPKEIASLVGSLEALSRITKTRIDKEREAFGINSMEQDTDSAAKSIKLEFVEVARRDEQE